jgi:membrane protein
MSQWLIEQYRRATAGELPLSQTWWAQRLLNLTHTAVVVVRQTGQDKLHVRAATLAYWSAVGFVPLLVLGFALTAPLGVKAAALEAVREMLYESLLGLDDEQIITVVESMLDRVNLSALGWLGVGGIMMIGSQIYFASELAYNDIYGTRIRRSWFFRFFGFNAVIIGVPLCIAGGIILSSRYTSDVAFSGWIASLFLTTVALVSAIKILPNTKVHWRSALIGGVISAALFEISKYGFTAYMDLLGTKDNMTRLYGSVAFLPVFLLWLNVLWLVVLMGVELAFVMQHRRSLVEAQAERAGDPHASLRHPGGLFAVGVVVALVQAQAASKTGTADVHTIAERCGVWSGHVRDALNVLEAAQLVSRTRDGQYSLLQPCEELRVAEVLGHWFEIGSPRLGDACEVSELMHRLRAQLEESMDHTVAEVAGLEAVAQEA